MPARHSHLRPGAVRGALADSLAALRDELDIPDDYPPEALAEAERAASSSAVDGSDADRADMTDIRFHTIDPPTSRDLDQAMHLERSGDGFVVHYAIADVAAFVTPGGALDQEVRRRGQTLYAPDGAVPLHPEPLSHGVASLLPDERRRAYVWRIQLDASGAVGDVDLTRAWVRSRRKWSYDEAQREIDAGTAPDEVALLRVIGPLRIERESARGGASLNIPEEEVVETERGYDLIRRAPLPVEDWNAQISLLTGMAAADLMLAAGVGILRTLPPADEESLAEFRATTRALGRPWPDGVDYGEYLRTLDPDDSATAAVMVAATVLFRGAGYEAFDGEPPEETEQAAIGAPYAHTTAPLRRLVDRWSLAICEAEANGREVPQWAADSLGELPGTMQRTGTLASRLDSGAVDRIEAAVLTSRIGDALDAAVVAETKAGCRVQIIDPFVTAHVPQQATAGTEVRVRVVSTDIAAGGVELELAG